jgi:hypothetical protein
MSSFTMTLNITVKITFQQDHPSAHRPQQQQKKKKIDAKNKKKDIPLIQNNIPLIQNDRDEEEDSQSNYSSSDNDSITVTYSHFSPYNEDEIEETDAQPPEDFDVTTDYC